MILVTGGAGFIGSNLVAGLAAAGRRDIAIVDRLGSEEKWRNVAGIEIDALVPPERLEALLSEEARRIQAVVHLGAISATTERDADLIVATNFTLSQRIWRWCAGHAVPLIYASSAATYGDGAQGFDDDGSVDGLARLAPLNAYGWSKHLFDRWVARAVAGGAPRPPQWAGLKFFNVYGPNEGHKGAMRSVAFQIALDAAAGRPARLFRSHHPDYPDGGQLRDFIHVDDCVRAILWLLAHREVSGLFNLGTGRARSFLDLAHAVFAALGRPPAVAFVDTPAEIRANYQYRTEARMERLRAAGFDGQFTPLEDGVARYVRRLLATPAA